MEDELSVVHEMDGDYRPVSPVVTGRLHPVAACLFGAWYSIIFACAMSAGVKYLHHETPEAHGILQSFAWAIGSGMAIALASRLSRTHRFAVGICSSVASASVWICLLMFLSIDFDQATGETVFGYSISLKQFLIGFSLLILLAGVVSSFLAASSDNDEELTARLLTVPSRHWMCMGKYVADCGLLHLATICHRSLLNLPSLSLVSGRFKPFLRLPRYCSTVCRH